MLEMTDRHGVTFYLMFAGMVTSIVFILIDKHSFHDRLKYRYMYLLDEEEKEEQQVAVSPAVAEVNIDATDT